MVAPAALGVMSAVTLLLRLVALFFVKPGRFRVFSTGVHVSASQLLSLPDWIGKKFVTVNKHVLRQYGTHSGGDEKTFPEVWSEDRYYIQEGVNVELGVEANPLLGMLMEQHTVLRLAVCVLQTLFTVHTASVWINGKGEAATETHFDSDHNLVLVLHGSCIFHTAPRSSFGPDISDNMSTNTPRNSPFFTPHLITAGQAAIQPGYMWHYVQSSAHCVKIALFFS